MKLFKPIPEVPQISTTLVCFEGTHELLPQHAYELKKAWLCARAKVGETFNVNAYELTDLQILQAICEDYAPAEIWLDAVHPNELEAAQ